MSEIGQNESYYDRRVKYEEEETLAWYTYGAEKGDVQNQFDLAYKYFNGDGVEKSLENAKKWFEEASRNGHQGAKTALQNLSF